MAYGVNYYQQDSDITLANFGGQDKFGNSSITDSGNQTGLTFTRDRAPITANVSFNGGSTYNYWNRTIAQTNGIFNIPTSNSTHVNWYNSRLDMGALGNSTSGTFGNWNNRTVAGNVATGRSWNFYNCNITGYSSNTHGGMIFDDLVDSTLDYQNGVSPANGFYGATFSKAGANLVRSTINIPVASTGSPYIAEHAFQGSTSLTGQTPARVEDMVFYNTRLSQLNYPGNVLLISPNFPNAAQADYFNSQPHAQGKGWMVIGPYIFGRPTSGTVSATTAPASQIVWGGNATNTPGHFYQFHGYNPTFYTDAGQTTPATDLDIYVSTNLKVASWTASNNLAGFNARLIPSSFTVETDHQAINNFRLNSSGKLVSSRYSTDGGTTWSVGYLDFGRIVTDGTADTDVTFETFNGQAAPANTAVMPIQALVKPAATLWAGQNRQLSAQFGLESRIDIRGIARQNTVNRVTLDDSDFVNGRNGLDTSVAVVPDSVTAKNTTSATISARFPNTGVSSITYNDIHDANLDLWSQYDTFNPPEVVNGIATLRVDSETGCDLTVRGHTITNAYDVNGANNIDIRNGTDSDIVAGADEAIQGLGGDTLSCGDCRFVGGTLAFNVYTTPRVHTSTPDLADLEGESAFNGVTMSGEVQVTTASQAHLVFNNCTIPTGGTLSVTRSGTGTVYVYGAPAGTTLGTGVVPVRTWTITRTALSGETSVATHQGRLSLFDADDGANLDTDITPTSVAGGVVTYALSSVDITGFNGQVAVAYSSRLSTSARASVDVGATTESSSANTALTVSAIEDATGRFSGTAGFTFDNSTNTAIGYNHGNNELTVGVFGTAGTLPNASQTLGEWNLGVYGTVEWNAYLANYNTTTDVFRNDNPITQVNNPEHFIVNATNIYLTPSEALNQTIGFVGRPAGVTDAVFLPAYVVGSSSYRVGVPSSLPTGVDAADLQRYVNEILDDRLLTRDNQVGHGILKPTVDLNGNTVTS